MGGGALMTPILVLLFKVQPLAAVSSDLVASMVMKPVGAGVHLRRGTVNWMLVRWLAAGSIPFAFAGVFILKRLGNVRLWRIASSWPWGLPCSWRLPRSWPKASFNFDEPAGGKLFSSRGAPPIQDRSS